MVGEKERTSDILSMLGLVMVYMTTIIPVIIKDERIWPEYVNMLMRAPVSRDPTFTSLAPK